MKRQSNKYYEYIDEFRKISTLQKLPTLTNRLQNMFEDDVEKDNNNFMRIRKQPIIDRWDNPENQNIVLTNQCVQEKVDNLLKEQHEQYEDEDGRVRGHINMFKKWSQLNKDINNKNESFQFFYKNASPPRKISSQLGQEDKKAKQKAKYNDLKVSEQNQKSELDLLNIGTQKSKYDFKIINEKRMDQFEEKPERQKIHQTEKEEDLFQQTFRKFQKYKTLEEISAMDQIKMAENQFFYDLNGQDEDILNLDKYFFNKFIYKSVTKSLKDTEKDVEYFRDIGLPSRNLAKYTEVMTDFRNGKQAMQEDTKEQAHFLHLLRQSELNINKNDMTYDDISNITNGRVTSLNAYMCIRSEKVTKAQFEKLLKKLDKYKKQEMQKGKQKVEIGVITEDIDLQFNTSDRLSTKQQKNSINELINEISEIRQSKVLMKPRKDNDGYEIMDHVFNKQKFTRMEILLKKLFDKIVVNPNKYPFAFLEEYLDRIDQILVEEYRDGKILWYIIECYEQILNNLPDEDNIKSILKKKPVDGPKVTHYKGGKLLKQEKLKATHLFTYREKGKGPIVPTNDGSKVKKGSGDISPSQNGRKQVTPTKTAIKKPFYSKVSPINLAKTKY